LAVSVVEGDYKGIPQDKWGSLIDYLVKAFAHSLYISSNFHVTLGKIQTTNQERNQYVAYHQLLK
jgi:hypothetical protein